MPNRLLQFSRGFLKLFLLTFLFQIQMLVYKSDFFSGQYNNFAAFFVNFAEICLILSLFCYGISVLFARRDEVVEGIEQKIDSVKIRLVWLFLILLVGAVVGSVFVAGDKVLAFLWSLRVVEMVGLVWLIYKGVLEIDTVVKYLFIAFFIQFLIGFLQYLLQSDLGLRFLGESKLGGDILNVAKVNLSGEKILRAYGTLPHANIFGAVIFVGLALAIQRVWKKYWWKYVTLIIFFSLGLLISFSRSAWLALAGFLLVIFAQNSIRINWKQLAVGAALLIFVLVAFNLQKVIWARFMDISLQAFDERGLYAGLALQLFQEHPVGIGIGNFVLMMGGVGSAVLSPWLFQPVHNLFLLLLVETGMQGMLVFIGLVISLIVLIFSSMKRLVKHQIFYWSSYIGIMVGLMVLASFDHYLWTSFQGMTVMFLVFGLILRDAWVRRFEAMVKEDV